MQLWRYKLDAKCNFNNSLSLSLDKFIISISSLQYVSIILFKDSSNSIEYTFISSTSTSASIFFKQQFKCAYKPDNNIPSLIKTLRYLFGNLWIKLNMYWTTLRLKLSVSKISWLLTLEIIFIIFIRLSFDMATPIKSSKPLNNSL